MRSSLKLGRSIMFYGHPLYLVMPEQQDEVLQEILTLNEVLPEVNVLLPETAAGVVPLLQIWPSDINFDETIDAPEEVINFTHFRHTPVQEDGTPVAHPQTLYFCSKEGVDNPLSHQYEPHVAGMLMLTPDSEVDLALVTMHVNDTFTVCRFCRAEDGVLKLDRSRHRNEEGEFLRLYDSPTRKPNQEAEERLADLRKNREKQGKDSV